MRVARTLSGKHQLAVGPATAAIQTGVRVDNHSADPAHHGSRVAERRVDPALAREVAAAYLDAPARPDPLTAAAYARLVTESDGFFASLTSPDQPAPVHVVFSRCPVPYRDAGELIASVTGDRVLEVTTVAAEADRRHPLMDSGEGQAYDRFRAVHDILGHARLRLGFDRDGEFATWLSQERLHSPLARQALATELHGQHSVRWTTGEMAAPKAVLLDGTLLRRTRAGMRVRRGGSLASAVPRRGRGATAVAARNRASAAVAARSPVSGVSGG